METGGAGGGGGGGERRKKANTTGFALAPFSLPELSRSFLRGLSGDWHYVTRGER